MSRELEGKVCSVIADYQQNNFLVAVSGGADSMALLSAICVTASLREGLNVLHVDHGLRGQESKDDAEFVRAFCAGFSRRERSIPCTIVTIPEGEVLSYARAYRTGLEAAARHFRRKALLDEAKRLDKPEGKTLILTAHNKDDALELYLMRILRGSGPAGLAAMPVKSGRFVRPLLDVTREEIIAYLKEKNIPWREDSTNACEKFLRNKIRHKLIPFLDELFMPSRANLLFEGAIEPSVRAQGTRSWKKGILNIAETQSLVSKFLEEEAKKRILWDRGDGSLITNEDNFFSQPQIVREEAVYKAFNILSASRTSGTTPLREGLPKRNVIRQFCEGKARAYDLGPARIVRKKGKITLLIK